MGASDGYELEGRVAAGPWEKVHDGLIPPDVVGGSLTVDSSVPELTALAFRIRAVRSRERASRIISRALTAPTLRQGPGRAPG